jgi:hypothetical protein
MWNLPNEKKRQVFNLIALFGRINREKERL